MFGILAVPKRGDFVTEIVSGDSERYFAVKYDGNKELLNLDELREDVDTLSRDGATKRLTSE